MHCTGNAPRQGLGVFAQGCGVLRHAPTPGTYRHIRYPSADALADWVQHFWLESWDLQGSPPQLREVLPHPCVHLVLAPERSRIYGLQLRRFVRVLRGRDRIIGVKFRPGAFYPFLGRPVHSLADSSIPAATLFPGVRAAERRLAACDDEPSMMRVAADLVLASLPAPDPQVGLARDLVEQIAADRSLIRVEQLVRRSGLSARTLERLFRRYVGSSARWVIKRYRVYEALERLSTHGDTPLTALAHDLGYYDQAHFINDFRRLVGRSPSAYLRPPG